MHYKKILTIPRLHDANMLHQEKFYKALREHGYQSVNNINLDPISIFIKRKEFDIINFQFIGLGNNFLYAILAFIRNICFLLFIRCLGKRSFFTLFNFYPHDVKFKFLERIQRIIFLFFVEFVFITNESIRESIRKEFFVPFGKIYFLEHGNYIGSYENTCTLKEAEEYLGIKKQNQKKYLLFLGAVRNDKGIVEYLREHKNELDDFFIIIAGEFLYESDFIQISELYKDANMVIFNRYIRSHEIQYFMKIADFGLLPFKYLTTSGTLMLFLSFGMPVLTTKKSYTERYVQDGLNGFFLETFDFNILNTANPKEMGENALKSMSQYNWENIAAGVSTIFKKYF